VPSASPPRALQELAIYLGVLESYQGVDRREHVASAETLIAIVRALGIPIEHIEEAPQILSELRELERKDPFAPVVASFVGDSSIVALEVPSFVDPTTAWVSLVLESGEVHRSRFADAALRGEPNAERLEGVVSYKLDLERCNEGRLLEPGYHELFFEGAGFEASCLLIVAPRCKVPTLSWGTFLPLHALRSAADRGVGSYSDLAELASFTGERGGGFVGTLPLYPSFLEGPAPVDPSPYLPVSRVAWNELYIDVFSLEELALSPKARELLGSGSLQSEIRRLCSADLVDYGAAMALIRPVLEACAAALVEAGPSDRRSAFERWCADHPEAEQYAAFRGRDNAQDALYFRYSQWIADQQLESISARASGPVPSAGLYLDLPVGVHPDGFDPVHWAGSFVPGVHGGAPPDSFSPTGQDWAFPPLHPHGIRRDRHAYPIAMLRHVCRHASVLRLDHVMGLSRLYFVPEELDARQGAYVSYPAEELRAVVCLEAHRSGVVVVGEDLGTVPNEVRQQMAHDRMLRSFVMQFEVDAKRPLPDPPEFSMASWGTHDLARFAAYIDESDIDERANARSGGTDGSDLSSERRARAAWKKALPKACGLGSSLERANAREALCCCLRHLASSTARLVLVDLEDLWGETEPQNRPGTGVEADNWRRRAARTLDEMRQDSWIVALLRDIDAARRERRQV
jgi:4-alpha-glucanotransferase